MKKTSLYLKLIFTFLVISNFFLVNIAFNRVIDGFFEENIKNQNLLTVENLKEHILKKEYAQIQRELDLLTEYEIFTKIIIYDYQNEKIFESIKENANKKEEFIQKVYDFDYLNEKIATIHFFYKESNKDEITETFREKITIYKLIIYSLTFLTIYILLKNIEKNYLNRVKAEYKYKREKEKAEEANRAKSQFLAKMSHELKTPLNGITTITDLLILKSEKNDKKYLELIKSSSNNLLNLVNDILDLSKLENNSVIVINKSIKIREVLDELTDLCYIKKRKNVHITTFVSNKVPKVLKLDGNKLKQIISNILSNSVKFTHEGFIDIFVDISSKNLLSIEIKDTGIGIKEEDINHIFENFNQGTSPLRLEYGGSGLGLAIVKSLISLMGGSINLSSVYNKGTNVIIKLPFEHIEDYIQEEKKEVITLVKKGYQSNLFKTLNEYGNSFYPINNFLDEVEVLDDYVSNSIDFIFIVDIDILNNDESIINYISEKNLGKNLVVLYDEIGQRTSSQVKDAKYLLKPFSINKLTNLYLTDELGANPYYKGKVLLVEDNEVNIIGISRLLKKFKLNVDIAKNLKESRLMLKNNYNIILLDIQLPDGNGLDLAKEIRGCEDKTPIVIISAHDTREYINEANKIGVNEFVPKPLTLENLNKVFRKYLSIETFEGKKTVVNGELVQIFWKQYALLIQSIEANIDNKEEVLKILHKLKGSISNFDQGIIYEKIKDIEKRAKDSISNNLVNELLNIQKLLKEKIGD